MKNFNEIAKEAEKYFVSDGMIKPFTKPECELTVPDVRRLYDKLVDFEFDLGELLGALKYLMVRQGCTDQDAINGILKQVEAKKQAISILIAKFEENVEVVA